LLVSFLLAKNNNPTRPAVTSAAMSSLAVATEATIPTIVLTILLIPPAAFPAAVPPAFPAAAPPAPEAIALPRALPAIIPNSFSNPLPIAHEAAFSPTIANTANPIFFDAHSNVGIR